jgi:TRAP-type C4-dicarboxylate transport system permease small subunit
MRPRRGPLDKAEDGIRLIVGAALLVMVIGTTLDAAGRYLFGSSLPGMIRTTEWFLMPAIVFLSWGAAQRNRKHVAVDLLRHRLSARAAGALRRVTDALGLLLFGLVLWTTAGLAIGYWGRWSVESPSLSAGPSRAIVVVGAAFMVLRLAVQLVRGDSAAGPDHPAERNDLAEQDDPAERNDPAERDAPADVPGEKE